MGKSIYTCKEIEYAPPGKTCELCTETAFEIADGHLLCGIPGNHPDLEETDQSNELAA